MVMELTLGNVITLVALVVAAMFALAKLLAVQQERRLDDRFASLTKALDAIAASQAAGQESNRSAVLELEREFRAHQAELERNFVRRDDFIRHVGVIETRIDNFALRMERALSALASGQKGAPDVA